ncbi:MAG: caspase family protein [Alphaproteobacteria bacterium]|nr:caspase family protein [Alphaproteobacteria bacterium]
MMRIILLLIAALIAAPATAAPTVRAVFVGIDVYRFSNQRRPGAGFDDLSGAVADAGRIKAALGQALGVAFDQLPANGCQSANDRSITLINQCATRASILASWAAVANRSQPQDILILYFAGHGSRFIDGTTLDQASRYNSTLMPHDARDPGALTAGDILDHEVRRLINAATSRGVRVVTIFDSCNSGTANRNGTSASRSAPSLAVANLTRNSPPAQYGNMGAWRVHLAAAGDGQDAQEAGSVGQRAGLFTTALARALAQTPGASFADLAARAVIEVTAASGGRQLPHAEGALRASLNGEEIRVPLFQVVRERGGLLLLGGGLLGVTPGSRFALFGATSAALDAGTTPLATARVVSVRNSVGQLQLEGPAPPGLPARLMAREVHHEFGGPVLALASDDAAAAQVAAGLGFVRVAADAPFRLQRGPAGMLLARASGLQLAALPPPEDPAFRPQLAAALGKIARVEQWLAGLRSRPDLCLAVSNAPSAGYNPASCPSGPPPASVTLRQAQSIRLGLVNRAAAPRQLYVFHIGPRYDVTLVLPAFGGRDSALPPGEALRDGVDIYPTEPGDVRIVALSSSVPLDVSALEQTGTDVIDSDACLTAVARNFCQRADTSRSGTAGEARAWSAVIIPARVLP